MTDLTNDYFDYDTTDKAVFKATRKRDGAVVELPGELTFGFVRSKVKADLDLEDPFALLELLEEAVGSKAMDLVDELGFEDGAMLIKDWVVTVVVGPFAKVMKSFGKLQDHMDPKGS